MPGITINSSAREAQVTGVSKDLLTEQHALPSWPLQTIHLSLNLSHRSILGGLKNFFLCFLLYSQSCATFITI